MNTKDCRPLEMVTWGTGSIRARVVQPPDAGGNVVVVLTEDYRTPCGMTVPQGTHLPAMVSDLRAVQ